jgi:hypothetical protein
MKKIIFLFLMMIACTAQAQVLQTPANYGIGWRRTGADTLLYIPSDTLTVPAWGIGKTMLARKGTALYYWNGSAWTAIGGGSSTNIYNSDGTLTGDRLLNGNNHGIVFEDFAGIDLSSPYGSAAIGSNNSSIRLGIDTIEILPGNGKLYIDSLTSGSSTDSLLTWNAGTGRVGKRAVSDAVANIYNSDGTLTGDRTVNFNTGRMDFSSVNEFNVSDAMSDRLYIGNSTSIYSRVIGQNQSSVNIAYNRISLFPTLGNLYIDTLTSGSTIDSLVTWSAQNGRIAVRRAGTTGCPIRTTTSNVTFGDGDHTVIVTGGTPSVTLPTASSYSGRIFKIVNQTAGGLTTTSHIDLTGSSSTTTAANSYKIFHSNGISWYLISSGSASGGSVTAASGSGISLVNGSSAIKRLKAGSGITVTDNTDSVEIAINEPVDYSLLAYQALGSAIKAQTVGGNYLGSANAALTSQRCYFVAVYLPKSSTITGVKWNQITQGNYTADNYNGVGLYSYNAGTLTLVASSTNDGNIWKGSGNTLQSKAFSSTYVASAGIYFVAFLYSSSAQTAAPTISGIVAPFSPGGAFILDFTNSAKLVGTISSQTALPSPTQAISGISTTNAIVPLAFLY